jgi:hypothetical protein
MGLKIGKIFKAAVNIGKVAVGASTGNWGMALSGASGLAGGGGGGGGGQGNTANGAYFDYFAVSRPQYGARLNTLMGYGGTAPIAAQDTASTYADWKKIAGNKGKANYNTYVEGFKPTAASPGISGEQAAINDVLNSPGYTGGLRASEQTLSRNLARTGQVASGAEQIAYGNLGQDYFRKSYQDLFNQYASLSGATQQPLNMASANQLAADQSRLQDQALAQSLGALGGGIKDIFSSSSNNASINANPAGYSSGGYASGATSYSPTDTNIGMGGYTGPDNMGGGLVGPNWGGS